MPPFYQSPSRLGIRDTLIRECEFRGEPRARIVRRHVRVLPTLRDEKMSPAISLIGYMSQARARTVVVDAPRDHKRLCRSTCRCIGWSRRKIPLSLCNAMIYCSYMDEEVSFGGFRFP